MERQKNLERGNRRAFSRRAQIQIMENIFVLIIIIIILFLAFVAVVGFQKSEYRAKMRELKELELIKKSQILSFLPEMQCSINQDIEGGCYDVYKVLAFRETIAENPEYYNPLLGNIRIEIRRLNPSPGIIEPWTGEWLVYDNPSSESVTMIQYPVILRNQTNNYDYFGVIYLGVYG